jgi:hypothetical protein
MTKTAVVNFETSLLILLTDTVLYSDYDLVRRDYRKNICHILRLVSFGRSCMSRFHCKT